MNKIESGEMISVFALGEDFQQNDEPLLQLCNPGDGSDKSEWTANLKKLKRQYEERFFSPILTISNELTNIEAAKRSPVMEQIQLVAINGFKKQHITGNRKLIIVSDMLQNTPEFSMYKTQISYSEFIKQDYAQRVKPDLNNVKVELYYIMNSPKLQTRRHLNFWEQYFDAAGARITLVKTLEG
ncbi:hypothetical protein [Caviibacterium pharyngocola]|nr:hypothetical protein [Caviibacterium pharyngocola]